MSEYTELVTQLRKYRHFNRNEEAADAIEALGRQYEVRGEILTAAIERAEKAERLAGFALDAIGFMRFCAGTQQVGDPDPQPWAAMLLERHGIPLTEEGDE